MILMASIILVLAHFCNFLSFSASLSHFCGLVEPKTGPISVGNDFSVNLSRVILLKAHDF